MRHLPVCDNSGEVVGMLTRKNLMHYLLTDQKEKELIEKEREIQKLKNKLKSKDQSESSEESQQNDKWFSNN